MAKEIDIENDNGAITHYNENEPHTNLTDAQVDGALSEVIPGYQPFRIKRTDEIDWKNGGRIPPKASTRVPSATAATPTPAPSPTQTQPSPEELENGKTYVRDGKGVTRFGNYIRIVEQNGDPQNPKTRWTDLSGNQVDEPKSEQMRRMMLNGHTSLGVQSAGFKSWDEALAAQKGGEQAEALAKSMAYGAQLLEQQRYGEEVAKKRLTNRRLAAGDAFGVALGGLNAEIARTEDGKIIGRDGKPVDKRVRVSADGKRIYLMNSVEPGVLDTANKRRRANGGTDNYNSIIAYREIDVNGNPVKDKNGNDIPPYIAVRDTPGGQSGTDVKQRFRTMSLRDVSDKLLRAHRDAGHGDDDTIKTATINQLGGWDPNGWGKTPKQKPNDGKLTFEQRVALEKTKNEGRLAVEEARLNRSNAPKSKADFITGMLEKVQMQRVPTEDEIKKGYPSDKLVNRSPEEIVDFLGNIYDSVYRNQDPALGGGNGGGSPIVVSPFDPLHPDNPAITTPAPAPQPQPQGGGQAQAQTATPSNSATATPPAEGQGELDFGGGEPEAGNLTHEGRKWKLYTDNNGKVSGYGTTRSMVTKTNDGRFAVIPTIVNGEELSEADAVEHFKKTGEHWGIVKTEDEAKKLAEQVHLDGQEHERAAWNEYIQDHWDEMSDEIRNDPGVAEERKRRHAAKPKSNSWKNSALFK